MDYIHKYKSNDFIYNPTVEEIMRNIEELKKPPESINRVISNYESLKYLKEIKSSNDFDFKKKGINIDDVIKTSKKQVAIFMSKINKNNLIDYASTILEPGYQQVFLDLLADYKCLERINWFVFKDLFSLDYFFFFMVFRNKEIVNFYDKEILLKIPV